MEQLKERIEEVAKYKEVSIRQMESACQLKRGNLSNISKCGTIGLDKASKIRVIFAVLFETKSALKIRIK